MDYKVVSTQEMNRLLEEHLLYLTEKLQNRQAADNLISNLKLVYQYLSDNPYLFRECRDPFLRMSHYREVKIPKMDYILIYKIKNDKVYVMGIFHTLEDYVRKIKK